MTVCTQRILMRFFAALLAGTAAAASASPSPAYDLLIRGGTIYDGSGGAPYVGDVAVRRDRIATSDPIGG
jgi:N-acyl-D-aspartate/D-glutamate deacylase